MINLDDFFSAFNLSPNTEKRYRPCIELLLTEKGDDLSALSAKDLKSWLLDGREWSSSQQCVTFAAIKKYLRWRYGEIHPALGLKIKRIQSPPGRSLTMTQVQDLLASFNTATPKGRRDLAICSLFIDSALRCSEMCNLQLSRLDLQGQTLTAFVKGRTWKPKWFSIYTASLLSTWLAERPSFAASGAKTVFVSIGGETPGHPFTRQGLGDEVGKWGQRIGIQLSPHDLRRTFGNQTARAGASERVAMIAGGWESEAAYRRYTLDLTPQDIEPYSPIMIAMGLVTR